MPNLTITNIDEGSYEIGDGVFIDDELTFATSGTIGTDYYGTILARDSVSLKLVPYVKGGSTNENGIPKAVLTYAVEGTTGDTAVRVMVGGKGSFERTIIAADGDNSNVDKAVIDLLNQYAKINTLKEQELSSYDNQ